MTVELLVPALGESVVEATVAKWMKSPGESINSDEPLVELETEKSNIRSTITNFWSVKRNFSKRRRKC